MHKLFSLHKRPTTKKNKQVYYCQFYDESGNRLTARSTGQTSKAAAETWAYGQLQRGIIASDKNVTFGKYAEKWWIWDECPYVKSKVSRGVNLSRRYVDLMRAYLENHILPYFGKKRLQKINTHSIEAWIQQLREKKGRIGITLSHTTINHCLTCLKIMLKEAVRLGYLQKNPADPILQLKENQREKSILTLVQVKSLFYDSDIDETWGTDIRHYTINLLSASTGMRLGECQGLQIQHVHNDGYIAVVHTWDPKYGLKEPKRSSYRDIPIPSKTLLYLSEVIGALPYKGPDELVFIDGVQKVPIRNELVLKNLYNALENIGITKEERQERNITFHSWRHFYNSLMRGKIHDSKLRQLTGHRTLEMTEHYTHFNLADYQDVRQIQEQYFT